MTGFLAGARSRTATGIATARQQGDAVTAADLRTSLSDLRAAMRLHTGTPAGDVHRDGWTLTTPEARAYLTEHEHTYRGRRP